MKRTEQEVLQELGRLPRERQPATDLWPGIEARLGPARRRASMLPYALAAALAVAAVAGVLRYTAAPPEANAGGAEIAAAAPRIDDRENPTNGPAMVYGSALDLEYSGAARALARQIDAWAPDAVAAGPAHAALERNLDVLTRAADDLRAAIATDPESVYLAQMLDSTQRKKLAVMRQLLAQQDFGGSAAARQGRRT